jgi:hypothetical protein
MFGAWESVCEEFGDLNRSQQIALFEDIEQDLVPENSYQIDKLLEMIYEDRFAPGIGCVHYGSTPVKRNGKYRSRKRY